MTADDQPTAPDRANALAKRLNIRALFAVGGGNASTLVLGLVTGIITSRVLGPEVRGELVVIQTWAGMAGVLLTAGATQAVVVYKGSDEDLPRPLLLQAGAAFAFGLLLFILLGLSGAQPWINRVGIVGGAIMTAGMVAGSNSAGLAQRLGKMTREFQYARLAPQAFGVLAIVWLWRTRIDQANEWALALGLAVLLPSSVVMVSLLGGVRALAKPNSWLPRKQFVRQSGIAFVAVTGSMIIYQIDGLMVAIWMSSEKVALYAVAASAAGACVAIGRTVGMLLFSELRGIAASSQQRIAIQRGTVRTIVVTAALAIPLIAITPEAIRILYGNPFVPAASATRWLVLASIPLAADYLLVHALLMLGAGRAVFKVQVVAGLMTVLLLGVTIPTGRLDLVALVSVGTYSISAAILFVAAMRRTESPSSCIVAR